VFAAEGLELRPVEGPSLRRAECLTSVAGAVVLWSPSGSARLSIRRGPLTSAENGVTSRCVIDGLVPRVPAMCIMAVRSPSVNEAGSTCMPGVLMHRIDCSGRVGIFRRASRRDGGLCSA
jgi:hypothetical protein